MKVVFISGCWPGSSKGYEFAVDSDLNYLNSLSNEIYFFGPDCEKFNVDFKRKYSKVSFIPTDFRRESQAVRFVKSVFSINCPATSIRYKRGTNTLIKKLSSMFFFNEKITFIYQDVPCSILMGKINSTFINSNHVIRSHNVVFNGFLNMIKLPGLKGVAWKLELAKIKRLEVRNLNISDLSYSISLEDRVSYFNLNTKIDDVWPLTFDFSDYKEISYGDSKTVIHIGTADLRKGADLNDFIENTWPLIINKIPDAKLILAGKGTGQINNHDLNITGVGFVDHDSDILCKGGVFINPQRTGSGIKIKSIIAMASGKALVTTSVGIEGVDAIEGENYFLANDAISQADAIISLLANPDKGRKMGADSRVEMLKKYTSTFKLTALELMCSISDCK